MQVRGAVGRCCCNICNGYSGVSNWTDDFSTSSFNARWSGAGSTWTTSSGNECYGDLGYGSDTLLTTVQATKGKTVIATGVTVTSLDGFAAVVMRLGQYGVGVGGLGRIEVKWYGEVRTWYLGANEVVHSSTYTAGDVFEIAITYSEGGVFAKSCLMNEIRFKKNGTAFRTVTGLSQEVLLADRCAMRMEFSSNLYGLITPAYDNIVLDDAYASNT